MSDTNYVGRFAPSPTGPLHFGSLIAALAGYLEARSQGGTWLVRIEDIDPPREVPGSADSILRALEGFGLTWDGTVLYQSKRLDAYRAAVAGLLAAGHAYRCRCTRRVVNQQPGGIYGGQCRSAGVTAGEESSVRVLTNQLPLAFEDALQGQIVQRLELDVGDYVVQRRDRLFAYQLAVTLDDDYQGVTEIVRGCDLLDSTPRQIHLRGLLGLSQPAYAHHLVALDQSGQKLSKGTGAAALAPKGSASVLFQALEVLCQIPPPDLRLEPVSDQLIWAIKNWDISRLQKISSVKLDEDRNVVQTLHDRLAIPQIQPQ
ncbi:MAG: tRNA glutamyl-Q(34) synthetase GluQRS [Gammaproteobacteria bacterium]|nr:tRNA glutamyl-Q(34) synthetase GluQRS [Gammaproteobacteria bacterium]